MASEQGYYRVNLPNGLVVDILTQEGANKFLQFNGSQQQGFIAVNMGTVRQLRQYLYSNSSNNNNRTTAGQRSEAADRLLAIYSLFGFVADRASEDVFDAQVNTTELKAFLDHSFEVLKKISNSEIWKRTGLLQHRYDGEVLDTLVTFCKHKKFCQLFDESNMMKFLAEMCGKPQRLVCPEFAQYILRITNNTNISQEMYLDISTEKSYQKIEASGLLIQVLCVISLPCGEDYHSHCIILDKLQSCPKLLRKTLCKGKPARDVIDSVLKGANGYPRTVPEPVRKRLLNICQISDFAATKPMQNDGMIDHRICRNCSKSAFQLGMTTKLLTCSKCRNTYYCSRECQVADWKKHKKACNVGSKTSKTNEQTMCSYVQTYYFEILTAFYQKMQERGVSKTKLILDLDFRNNIGSDDSSSPALKGEFKIAVTEDYLSGRDAPAWFQDDCCDKAQQKIVLEGIADHYQRDLRSHILIICRHAAAGGGAGIFRIQLHSPSTMKPLFADEVVTAFGERDWNTLSQLLDPKTISMLRSKSARIDCLSDDNDDDGDRGMLSLLRRIRDFQASPQWDELQREAEAEGWDS